MRTSQRCIVSILEEIFFFSLKNTQYEVSRGPLSTRVYLCNIVLERIRFTWFTFFVPRWQLLSRDQAPERAQNALHRLQEATLCAAEATENLQRCIPSRLEARECESAAVCLRLTDAENRCAN
jgi:hypothetical protein